MTSGCSVAPSVVTGASPPAMPAVLVPSVMTMPGLIAFTRMFRGAIVRTAELMLTTLPPDAGKRGDAAFDVNNMPNAFVSKMRRKSSPPRNSRTSPRRVRKSLGALRKWCAVMVRHDECRRLESVSQPVRVGEVPVGVGCVPHAIEPDAADRPVVLRAALGARVLE